MEKTKKIILILLVVLLILGVSFFLVNFFKKEKNPNQEINISSSQAKNTVETSMDSPVIQPVENLTPEQTFEAFRLAMVSADIDKALTYIKAEKRDIYRSVYSQEESLAFYQTVSDYTFLKKNDLESTEEKVVYYFFVNGDLTLPYYLVMVKNVEGKWEIESI